MEATAEMMESMEATDAMNETVQIPTRLIERMLDALREHQKSAALLAALTRKMADAVARRPAEPDRSQAKYLTDPNWPAEEIRRFHEAHRLPEGFVDTDWDGMA